MIRKPPSSLAGWKRFGRGRHHHLQRARPDAVAQRSWHQRNLAVRGYVHKFPLRLNGALRGFEDFGGISRPGAAQNGCNTEFEKAPGANAGCQI